MEFCMNFIFSKPTTYLLFTIIIISPVANAVQWTLQSSINQAVSASPVLNQFEDKIGARNEEMALSTMWPDPSIELKIDNQVGLDKGSGNYAFSEITLSQDIPISRIKYQQLVAKAQLSATKQEKKYETLRLQNSVAKVYHKLQLAFSNFKLAVKRFKLAEQFDPSVKKEIKGIIVRYLTPLEKMRLNIITEKAHQSEIAAQAKLNEVLTQFYKLLVLDTDSKISVLELQPVISVPELDVLLYLQSHHPLLSSQQQMLQAATNQIDVARSSALKDPSISINRLRENFSTGTENVYGIMLNVEIPIQNRKRSMVSKAQYNVSQQRIELAKLKRELKINLSRSVSHLKQLIHQGDEFNKKVLKPAAEILKLSEKGFISGELNILSLIDANNTYFDANLQYLDLIYLARIELADINMYSGKYITNNPTHNLKKAEQ